MTPASRNALVLVATPIGNLGDLSPRAIEVLRDADMIAAEDTRRTRALLTHVGVPAGGRLRAVHAHNERIGAQTIVDAVSSGKRVAYVTDAGMRTLAELPALRRLHLIDVPITDAGLRVLAGREQLESLYIDGAELSEAAYDDLFRQRPGLHVHINQQHHDRDPHGHAH